VSAVGAGAAGMFATGNMLFGQSSAEAQQMATHTVKPLKYAYDSLKGISKQVVTWHHDRHYAGYVKKRNSIEQQLVDHVPKLSTGHTVDEQYSSLGLS